MIISPTSTRNRPARESGKREGALLPAITAWLAAGVVMLAGCGSGSGSQTASTTSTSSERGGPSSATALINTGIAQANAKQYQQAETTFRDVLVVSPGNKFAWYNLGLLAQLQNRPSAALADYSHAVATDPTYTPAMYNKAILLERADPSSALALYQRITAINAKAATAYLRESFVYDRLGDKAKAQKARAQAVALDKRLATVTVPAQSGSK